MQTVETLKKHRASLEILSEEQRLGEREGEEDAEASKRSATISIVASLFLSSSFFRCCQLSLCSPDGVAYFKTRRAKKSFAITQPDLRRGLSRARGRVQLRCHVRTRDDESRGRWKSSTGWIVRLFLGFPIALHIRLLSTVKQYSVPFVNFLQLFLFFFFFI